LAYGARAGDHTPLTASLWSFSYSDYALDQRLSNAANSSTKPLAFDGVAAAGQVAFKSAYVKFPGE